VVVFDWPMGADIWREVLYIPAFLYVAVHISAEMSHRLSTPVACLRTSPKSRYIASVLIRCKGALCGS